MPKIASKKKKKPYYSSLWNAVKLNNVNEVERLLKIVANVNEECGKDRETVLHLAAKKGSTEIVKLLMKNGADVKTRDRFGNTALHFGASHESVALELLKRNANVNAKNNLRETPLHFARSKAVVEQMILKGVDLDIRDILGKTALFKTSCKYVMEALLSAGANVNQQCGKDIETVLHVVSKAGYTELVKILLKKGADVNKRDRFGNTPLHRGAIHEKVALELIKYNADVNAKNALQQTPLHFARSVTVVERMIVRGVDLDVLDINGETALFRATKECYKWSPKNHCVIKQLITAGANVNQVCGEDHETVLHLAAGKELLEVVKLLLENGADVNKKDRFGNTPIHRGAFYEKVALELIKYNADVNATNEKMMTPLHFAGSAVVVKNMLAKGACLDAVDINGETPLFKATNRLCKDALMSIIKAGANLNQECGEDHETVLHYAAKNGSTDAVNILLKYGADVKKKDIFGNTPLHKGASQECIALELIKHNADLNAKNIFGETPLHYAGSEAIFNVMVARGVKQVLPRVANLLEVKTNRYFLREALLINEAETILADVKYEKTVSVDNLVLKRVCRVIDAQNRVYFERGTRVYPLLELAPVSNKSHRNPPLYCDILKTARRKLPKPKNKPFSNISIKLVETNTQNRFQRDFRCGKRSNIRFYLASRRKQNKSENVKLEYEVKKWDNTKNKNTEKRYRAQDKKKFKKRETSTALKSPKFNVASRKKRNKPVQDSFKLEYEIEKWEDAKEEKSKGWYRAQDKKKLKEIETHISLKRRPQQKNPMPNLMRGYKNVSHLLRSQEDDYYETCYFADHDAKAEQSNNGLIWGYYNKTWCRYKGRPSRCCCVKHLRLRSKEELLSFSKETNPIKIAKKPIKPIKQRNIRKRNLIVLSIELPSQKV